MVNEVRRQFKEIPGIMEGTGKPGLRQLRGDLHGGRSEGDAGAVAAGHHRACAGGPDLGVPGVMGLLAGGLTSGFVLATMLNNAGGAWDNAKKYIEKGAITAARARKRTRQAWSATRLAIPARTPAVRR